VKFNVYFSDGISRRLVVFARAPRRGEVKTRLAEAVPDAAEFYAAMLRDVLRLAEICAAQCNARASVFYTPHDAFDDREDSMRHFWQGEKQPQGEGDLGARMLRCLNEVSSTHIVLIGSDSPDLPPEYLNRAFEKLCDHDLVFGPARDGGFYLIGASRKVPDEIFQNVAWSSPQTLEQVLNNVQKLQLRAAQLLPWDDVDTPRDLRQLNTRLQNDPQRAPHCARWMRENLGL
jgi:uncharacterized protein